MHAATTAIITTNRRRFLVTHDDRILGFDITLQLERAE